MQTDRQRDEKKIRETADREIEGMREGKKAEKRGRKGN